MDQPLLQPRLAGVADLPAVNRVIERAVMTWDLAERVKRLSLPLYRYDEHDLASLEVLLLEQAHRRVVGVAAWEPASDRDVPDGLSGLLLHGLYVDPDLHGTGLGSRLIAAAEAAVRERRLDGLLVKAQRDAEGFFLSHGFERLPVVDPERHYPHRLWKGLSG